MRVTSRTINVGGAASQKLFQDGWAEGKKYRLGSFLLKWKVRAVNGKGPDFPFVPWPNLTPEVAKRRELVPSFFLS